MVMCRSIISPLQTRVLRPHSFPLKLRVGLSVTQLSCDVWIIFGDLFPNIVGTVLISANIKLSTRSKKQILIFVHRYVFLSIPKEIGLLGKK